MEAKVGIEVRRLHIIYFLSHMGSVEHPHLIRIHHLNRNGVFLRDVKRWLADLRGKHMPEAFAWSYKRRYKNGYVWQDLLDDDLITPIADNEYILKGSQIFSPAALEGSQIGPMSIPKNEKRVDFKDEKREDDDPDKQEEENKASDDEQHSPKEKKQIYPTVVSLVNILTHSPTTITFPRIHLDSPVFGSEKSALADDSTIFNEAEDPIHHSDKIQTDDDDFENLSSPSLYAVRKEKKSRTMKKNSGIISSSFSSTSSTASSSTDLPFPKSNSYLSPKMLRSMISCGASADANDAVLVAVNKSPEPSNKTEIGETGTVFGSLQPQTLCIVGKKNYNGVKDKESTKQQQSNSGGSKLYKPLSLSAPTCSQCGKSFRPEKMHAHMKSCRGMRSFAKSGTASFEKMPQHNSMKSSREESTEAYFLTNY
ncbi:hypothetical protein K2173_012366 [Erythroxylum novogranatense]|uniref:SOSEKI DIX-like domain-containing protein n=1 Tax=Erythroxylum novogranatense TaxID=1862640 RepID=A0AAV8U9M5_9ROSI|nr:hypothetical protein K2173_012366 [Erythroxylum novogranatense]